MTWKTKNLDEIAEVRIGYPTPKSESFFKNGVYDFIKTSDVGKIKIGSIKSSLNKLNETGIKKFKIFKKGTILFPKSGVSTILNHRVIMEKDGYIASTLAGIKANENFIYDKYLFYFLLTVDTKKLIPSSAYPGMNLKKICKIKISFPSLQEQLRIIDRLTTAFAEINKAKEANEILIKNSEELIQTFLNNIFYSDKNLSKLKDCCQINPPKSEVKDLENDTEVSFIPMKDLGINIKLAIPINKRRLGDVRGNYTYFCEEDILLAKITPCFENGKLGIASKLFNNVGFGSSEFIVFRTNKNLKKEWLYYFLNREKFRINGSKNMSGAVGHKRVNKDFIEETLIPIPPLEEQSKILFTIDNLSNFCEIIKKNNFKKAKEINFLKESILKKFLNIEKEKMV